MESRRPHGADLLEPGDFNGEQNAPEEQSISINQLVKTEYARPTRNVEG